MLFSQISRHFQQPGKSGLLVKRPDFINPAIHRQGPHHIFPGNPMNFHICKPFTYSTDNSHTLDNIPIELKRIIKNLVITNLLELLIRHKSNNLIQVSQIAI